MIAPFSARSASDRTDDWTFWYVRRQGSNLNLTVEAAEIAGWPSGRGSMPFVPRKVAEALAQAANEAEAQLTRAPSVSRTSAATSCGAYNER